MDQKSVTFEDESNGLLALLNALTDPDANSNRHIWAMRELVDTGIAHDMEEAGRLLGQKIKEEMPELTLPELAEI